MARVLETLSTKYLVGLVSILLGCLTALFLVGGLTAPARYSTIVSTPVACLDIRTAFYHDTYQKPFVSRGNGSCDYISSLNHDSRIEEEEINANQIVFSQWLPLARDDMQLRMSRWFQTMRTVVVFTMEYGSRDPLSEHQCPELMLDTTLYHRDASDGDLDWVEFASAKVHRHLDFTLDSQQRSAGTPGSYYTCDLLPFFELGSVHYDFYLVNFRIPIYGHSEVNHNIGKIVDIQFITIIQNGGFTKVWFSLKTVLFPLTAAALVWFWRRVRQQRRPASLLERTLFSLGVILSIMNLPVEWVTLWTEMPFLLLLNAVREGAFHAMLLSFWLVFVGEHRTQVEGNNLRAYWKHLSAVIIACLVVVIFDVSERGVPLSSPFSSIWASPIGAKMGLAFIIIACLAASGYFFFLSFMVIGALRNISAKASESNRRTVFRCKCVMVTTLTCAGLTVVHFIVTRVSEGSWKWGDDVIDLTYVTAFLTGVYGMWNIYTIALFGLYAPSHKTTATQARDSDKYMLWATWM